MPNNCSTARLNEIKKHDNTQRQLLDDGFYDNDTINANMIIKNRHHRNQYLNKGDTFSKQQLTSG